MTNFRKNGFRKNDLVPPSPPPPLVCIYARYTIVQNRSFLFFYLFPPLFLSVSPCLFLSFSLPLFLSSSLSLFLSFSLPLLFSYSLLLFLSYSLILFLTLFLSLSLFPFLFGNRSFPIILIDKVWNWKVKIKFLDCKLVFKQKIIIIIKTLIAMIGISLVSNLFNLIL